jgi:50S ribosomal protein L16 3-hydroxylase
MKILEDLLHPHLSISQFLALYYLRAPYASPYSASQFCNLISWPLIEQIFRSGHQDCWPVRNGELSPEFAHSNGRLNPCLARAAFAKGRTILVRHSEQAHPKIAEIASEFRTFFHRPVDVQLYVTPEGEEGFDWHYDVEEVFIIQSQGTKEFRLLRNTVTPRPLPMMNGHNMQFSKEQKRPEIRCLLKPGDWLYIPSGYWHKAKALTDSFHMSIGVLNQAVYQQRPLPKAGLLNSN